MASDAKELSGGDGKLAQHNEPSPEEYKQTCDLSRIDVLGISALYTYFYRLLSYDSVEAERGLDNRNIIHENDKSRGGKTNNINGMGGGQIQNLGPGSMSSNAHTTSSSKNGLKKTVVSNANCFTQSANTSTSSDLENERDEEAARLVTLALTLETERASVREEMRAELRKEREEERKRAKEMKKLEEKEEGGSLPIGTAFSLMQALGLDISSNVECENAEINCLSLDSGCETYNNKYVSFHSQSLSCSEALSDTGRKMSSNSYHCSSDFYNIHSPLESLSSDGVGDNGMGGSGTGFSLHPPHTLYDKCYSPLSPPRNLAQSHQSNTFSQSNSLSPLLPPSPSHSSSHPISNLSFSSDSSCSHISNSNPQPLQTRKSNSSLQSPSMQSLKQSSRDTLLHPNITPVPVPYFSHLAQANPSNFVNSPHCISSNEFHTMDLGSTQYTNTSQFSLFHPTQQLKPPNYFLDGTPIVGPTRSVFLSRNFPPSPEPSPRTISSPIRSVISSPSMQDNNSAQSVSGNHRNYNENKKIKNGNNGNCYVNSCDSNYIDNVGELGNIQTSDESSSNKLNLNPDIDSVLNSKYFLSSPQNSQKNNVNQNCEIDYIGDYKNDFSSSNKSPNKNRIKSRSEDEIGNLFNPEHSNSDCRTFREELRTLNNSLLNVPKNLLGFKKLGTESFESLLLDGLNVIVYLTSREGETKKKKALIIGEKSSSIISVEVQSSTKNKPAFENGASMYSTKRLKFDLATDVMMVSKGKGKGTGTGGHDSQFTAYVDDSTVLHFALKGKPELNVEFEDEESRDTFLGGFMQLISKYRSQSNRRSL